MSINQRGYWEGLSAECQHKFDRVLGNYLVSFFKKRMLDESIGDLGCGLGDYVKLLLANNIKADGFDGNPNTPELTTNICKILDLSIPIKFEKPYDWIISLEVGEHLPPEYEDVFIQNLHNNNVNGIILSWAIEGQGGHGHYNERNNNYIKNKIMNLGYTNDIVEEIKMRKSSSLWWFKNTIMVFVKDKNLNKIN